jgi:hypothetical protein
VKSVSKVRMGAVALIVERDRGRLLRYGGVWKEAHGQAGL